MADQSTALLPAGEFEAPERPAESFADIVIQDGWTIGDLETVEDCDEAFAVLTEAVAGIEGQIDVAKAKAKTGQYSDPVWFARAKAALRCKKAGLHAVNMRRAAITRADKQHRQDSRDRLLLDEIKAGLPHDQFMEFVRKAAAKRPDVFGAVL